MIYRRSVTDVTIEDRTIIGLAVPYEQRSKLIRDRDGLYSETIAKGAFDRSIEAGSQVWAFYHHNPQANLPLGRLGANLSLRSADDGVRFALDLPNTTMGNDVLELFRTGVLTGAVSVSYDAPPSKQVWDGVGTGRHRRVLDGLLKEISIVPAGAFPQAMSQLLASEEAKWRERKWSARKEGTHVG